MVGGLDPTDVCQLEPAEDSFLEFGKSVNEVPEVVIKWSAGEALSGSKVSKEEGPTSSLRLLASNSSNAWFELITLESSLVEKGLHSAIPLAMHNEVGNGSWESSLVLPERNKDGGESKDLVTFDLVIAWG